MIPKNFPIVHVSGYYPPHLGGLEKVAEALAVAQHQHGYTVSVISSRDRGQSTYDTQGVKVDRLASIDIAHTPLMPSLLLKLLRLPKEAIVHIHIAQAYVPEMVWLASRLRGFHYVSHVHLDIAPSGIAGFLLKFYKPFILGRVLRASTKVIVFSDEQKAVMQKTYRLKNDQVRVLSNGVEKKFFNNASRSFPRKPRLLFVGRLSVQKNLQQLLNALKGISDSFETHIVGNGELEKDLRDLSSKLRLQNITFHGRMQGKPLLDMYRSADIFVLPSDREGMPLVLLEAMAMGLPIVGTDVTGIHDVVAEEQNGLLVPLNDPESLRLSLIKLKDNPKLYKKMSVNARSRAKDYSWDRIARQFIDLYEESWT